MIIIKLGEAYVEIYADQTKLTAGLNKAQKNVGASMKAIGKSMTIAGAVIVAGFGMAIKTAAKFEKSMALTASVAGATAEELKRLSDYARKMGEQSVFSASQAADGMYYLASAGMSVNEIMGALEGTLALAAATQSDLAYTSESVAAALSQFGLDADEATRVANVYAAAISGSQATMDKLSTSMSYVGPMAKSMGMSIEDTVGILMNLYNAGLDGSSAGTALRMAFVKLIEPTTKGTAALEGLRVSVLDSSGEMRPFKDIIDDLGKAGMTTADAIAIFGVRAGPALMALIGRGTGAIQEQTDAVTGTNKAFEMAEMQIDTFEGAMKLLRSAFEELQITLVQDLMPSLKGLIEWVTEGIKKVTAWMKENPKLTETIVKWTAAIGALMLVLGPLLMILPGLITALTGVKTAILAVGTMSTKVIPFINNLKISLNTLGGAALLAGTNIIIWLEVWRAWKEVAAISKTSADDVTDALMRLSDQQLIAAEKLGISVQEFVKMQKEGKTVTEMMDTLANRFPGYTDALNVWTMAAVEQQVGAKLIVTTIQDLTQEMSLLSKEYEAGNQAISESIEYYTDMVDLLNRTDVILQTELILLEEGTEEWHKKKEEIADNTKALNEINKALAKLIEPLKGLELIAAKMALLGDSTEDTKAKIELLNEKAVLLQQALDEAIPDTRAWWEAKLAFEGNQTAIEGLKNKLKELTQEEKDAIEQAKLLADAYKTITDKIYELTHTPMEVQIRKLDQQKQAYIDLGVEIGIVNKWYDLQIAKLRELNPELDETTGKLKEAGEAAKEAGDEAKDSWEGFTIVIKRATVSLSNFTKEGVAAAIATIKMKFFPILQDLYASLETAGSLAFLVHGQINEILRRQAEQIATVMYGYKEYQDVLKSLGGATNNLANTTANAANSMVSSWNTVTDAVAGTAGAIAGVWTTTEPAVPPVTPPPTIPGEGLVVAPIGTKVQATSGADYAWWEKLSEGLAGWSKIGTWFGGNLIRSLEAAGYKYEFGTPYVPRTGLAIVHKGEEINPPGQRSYDQRKSYSINIQPGAINIVTPKFSGADAKEMFRLIEREAKYRGLAFGRV